MSIDRAQTVVYRDGYIVVSMESGTEIQFSTSENPRLARGKPEQLNNIEFSPFGIHWPDLDEDLSFRGMLAGDHGQHQRAKQTGPTDGSAPSRS